MMSKKIETSESVSNTLNFLLKREGMSEAALAKEVDIPRNTINRLAGGRTPDPRISTLETIANYFNVSLDQLIGKEPISDASVG